MSPPVPGVIGHDGVGSLLAGLEPAQREAVLANDPVVCVLAGAGAGKTRVLTLRVARRIDDDSAHPAHVLVCTFSRRAADELRSRLWVLGARDGVTAGTFHRTALRLLGRYRADRGQPAPVVGDRRSVLAVMAKEGVAGGRSAGAREIARLDAEIGWAKARLVAPGDYEHAAGTAGRRSGMAPGRVAELYGRYEATRQRRGVLDLDDLLLACGDVLASDPAFAEAVRWWHRHLFVDEAQDMNEAQYRLLCLLAGEEPDLFAVGDPNQSVYGWNGADPGLVRRITEEFAGTRVVRLDANHRCTPQVVTAASAVLDLGGSAPPVSTRADGPLPQIACLPTSAAEAAWIARQAWLAHGPGRHWRSIAVLARTNAQLDRIAAAFEAERVPHRIAGGELGPASDVARHDRPGGRSAIRGAASVGLGTDDTAMDDGMDDCGTDDTAMDDAARSDPPGPSGRSRATAGTWDVGHGAGRSEERRGDGRDRDRRDGERAGERDEDVVVLSTFHRAKGLQWPVVFVAGLVDGTVPLVSARTRAARAEERRLLYVALTRAEDQLVCTWFQHDDELAAARGDDPRSASPWLEPIQQVVDVLRSSQAAPAPGQVAEQLARIRQLLPSGANEAPAGP
jgi:DNA helicase II / ATP-dependent DNA helicase PcrA